MRQNDPCPGRRPGTGGISRCLMRLMPRICVIDRSETVLPGSSPETEADSVGNGAADHAWIAEAVAEQAPVSQPWPAGSAVTGSRLDRAVWGAADVLRRHW